MFSSDIKFKISIIFGQLLVSIYFPKWIGVSEAERPIYILLTAILFILIDILAIVINTQSKLSKDYELWKIRNEIDEELQSIQTHFSQIAQNTCGKKDLFVNHFMKEIRKLANTIKGMAEKHELRCQSDHFLSVENVLDAFSDDKQKIWRYTWVIEEGDRSFDQLPWKSYFSETSNKFRQKKIKKIQALFILANPEQKDNPRLKKLLDYFYKNKMEAKLIELKDYRTLCEGNSIPADDDDFGIYANQLLFLTEDIGPKITVGKFVKDSHRIKQYVEFFDLIWKSCHVTLNPSKITDNVTLEELFTFDKEHPIQE